MSATCSGLADRTSSDRASGIGVTGINWDVRIIPAKFMTPSGGTTDSAIRAIDYIVDLKRRHGLNIVAINASFGSSGYSQAMLEALGRAAHADILFVVLSWIFVLSRLGHAYIHVTSNRITRRGGIFGIGLLVLLSIWLGIGTVLKPVEWIVNVLLPAVPGTRKLQEAVHGTA